MFNALASLAQRRPWRVVGTAAVAAVVEHAERAEALVEQVAAGGENAADRVGRFGRGGAFVFRHRGRVGPYLPQSMRL